MSQLEDKVKEEGEMAQTCNCTRVLHRFLKKQG